MADFDYSLRVGVNKTLNAISDPLIDVSFCSTAASQTPPTLQLSVASFGTANIEGVYSSCNAIGLGSGTAATTLVNASQFGTNATGGYMMFRETSGNTAAEIELYAVAGPSKAKFAIVRSGGSAFVRQPPSVGVAAAASAVGITGTIEVLVLGE